MHGRVKYVSIHKTISYFKDLRNCSDSQILSQDMHKRKIDRSLTDHAAEKQHKPEKYNNKNFP